MNRTAIASAAFWSRSWSRAASAVASAMTLVVMSSTATMSTSPCFIAVSAVVFGFSSATVFPSMSLLQLSPTLMLIVLRSLGVDMERKRNVARISACLSPSCEFEDWALR